MNSSEKMNDPIYVQIIENIKLQILKGVLKPNEKLSSVRELAVLRMVNPNTIQRAYRELESEGYIYTVLGKGNFVSENIEQIIERQRKILLEALREKVNELLDLHIKKEDIIKIIEES